MTKGKTIAPRKLRRYIFGTVKLVDHLALGHDDVAKLNSKSKLNSKLELKP